MTEISNRINNINNLIDSILSDADYSIYDNMLYQTKYLDSDKYNQNFDVVYAMLNRLYEKTRILYQLYENIEYYSTIEINAICEEIDNILNTIESQRQSLRTNADLVFNVNFKNEYDTNYADRDGSIIEYKAFIANGALTLQPAHSDPIEFSVDILDQTEFSTTAHDIDGEKELVFTRNTALDFESNYVRYNHLQEGGKYIESYASTIPINFVKKHIVVTLQSPSKVNHIDLQLSNCEHDTIALISDSNSSYTTDTIAVIKPIIISKIEFDIICSNGEYHAETIQETEYASYLETLKRKSIANAQLKDEKLSFQQQVQEYADSLQSFDGILRKYSDTINGFYNDTPSSLNSDYIHKSTESIDTFGNPYPEIATGSIYGKKEV